MPNPTPRWLTILLLLLFLGTATQAQDETKSEKAEKPQTLNKVEGIELPPNQIVSPKKKYTVLQPKFTDGIKVHQVEWVVVSVGKEPVQYTDLGEAGVIVATPLPDQSVLVYANALISDKDGENVRMTKHAVTVITVEGNGTPAPVGPNPTPAPVGGGAPTPVPVSVRGLSVVLVFDIKQQGNREIAELTTSSTLQTALGQSGSKFFAYDKDSRILDQNKFRQHLTQIPMLFVVADGGKKLLPQGTGIPIQLTGNSKQTEAMILDFVGRAASGQALVPGGK